MLRLGVAFVTDGTETLDAGYTAVAERFGDAMTVIGTGETEFGHVEEGLGEDFAAERGVTEVEN